MMKPYFETDLGKLYHGDCLEIMPLFGPIDAIVTDPVWPNSTPLIIGHDRPYQLFTEAMHKIPPCKRLAIHLGLNSDPRILLGVPKEIPFFQVCRLRLARPAYFGRLLYGADIAYYFGDPPTSRPGNRVISNEMCDNSKDGRQADHPCPRKIKHVAWIIAKWTNELELILDPFLGSGTTAIACERLNRRWIGIEISKEYCDIAVERIKRETAQYKMDLV